MYQKIKTLYSLKGHYQRLHLRMYTKDEIPYYLYDDNTRTIWKGALHSRTLRNIKDAQYTHKVRQCYSSQIPIKKEIKRGNKNMIQNLNQELSLKYKNTIHTEFVVINKRYSETHKRYT